MIACIRLTGAASSVDHAVCARGVADHDQADAHVERAKHLVVAMAPRS